MANRLSIVYHARNSVRTDIFLSSASCTIGNPANCAWQFPAKINDNAINGQPVVGVDTNTDQFMPGIDYTSSGNLIVTFYDRREDANNISYHEYFAHVSAIGGYIEPNRRACPTCPASDPGTLVLPGAARDRFIGDYQDVWTDSYPEGERAISAWVEVMSGGRSDINWSRLGY